MEVELISKVVRQDWDGQSSSPIHSIMNDARAKAKRWCLEPFFFLLSFQSVGYVLLLLFVRVNKYRTWHGGRVVSRNQGGNNKWNISGTRFSPTLQKLTVHAWQLKMDCSLCPYGEERDIHSLLYIFSLYWDISYIFYEPNAGETETPRLDALPSWFFERPRFGYRCYACDGVI